MGKRESKEKERAKHCQIVDIYFMQSFPISIVLCPFVLLTLARSAVLCTIMEWNAISFLETRNSF